MHCLLIYEKVPDFALRQPPFQAAHAAHVQEAADAGSLALAGSLGAPDDGSAMLLFEIDSPREAERFAQADPYVIEGIVCRWTVRTWDLVVGAGRVRKS